MKIKHLNKRKLKQALSLVWKVFCEYEAKDYPESGKQAFWSAIHSEEYLDMLDAYGAFEDEELIGIIAMRNEGRHVALFFVDGAFHKRGIGRSLWNAVLENNTADTITFRYMKSWDLPEPVRYRRKAASGMCRWSTKW